MAELVTGMSYSQLTKNKKTMPANVEVINIDSNPIEPAETTNNEALRKDEFQAMTSHHSQDLKEEENSRRSA